MNMIFRNKKIRLLLACISLLLLVNMIQESYAKYVSSASADSTFAIAEWAFKVNLQDVLQNSNFSSTIVPVIDTNPNIAAGVVAPTSTGYFDVKIDSSDVGVAFDEQITLSRNSTNTVTDLVFTGYKLNDGEVVSFSNTANPTFTINHNLNEENTVNVYRFYIAWIDGTGENMDNADDTQAASDGVASVKIDLRFIQKASNSS